MDKDGFVVDLFTGTGVVTESMLCNWDVLSVDIQHYSEILSNARNMNLKCDCNKVFKNIDEYFSNSLISNELYEIFNELIHYESFCIQKAGNNEIEKLYDIVENGSIVAFDEYSCCFPELEEQLSSVIEALHSRKIFESNTVTATKYFGGLYFSYYQSLQLDILLNFIENEDGVLKVKLIASLLSTASEIVNTVGKQFAQPLKVRDSHGSLKRNLNNKIIKDRTMNVIALFKKWFLYYCSTGNDKHTYKFYCCDYLKALKLFNGKEISVVYADPPYTRSHYSRYYHVLETLALRDNPEISLSCKDKNRLSRGMYRSSRHQSPFCIKSKCKEAFNELIGGVKELNANLVLSYSPFNTHYLTTPRLMPIDTLMDIAKKYYSFVDVCSAGHFSHARLNHSSYNMNLEREAELFLVCKN